MTEHVCANPVLYILQDVTVWVRLRADGTLGPINDTKAALTTEAHRSIGPGSDVVCSTCGWMGLLS